MRKIFSLIYNKMLKWSEHQYAPYYLAGISVAESSFFPLPPDFMLIPMSLAKPQRAWWYAALTTVCSVLGGVLGYALGYFLFELILPWIEYAGYGTTYANVQHLFKEWGIWIILMAGFSPVPYKLFTIGAGAMNMAFLPFFIASVVGRGARFFLVSTLLYFFGARLKESLYRYVDRVGWLFVIVLVISYMGYVFFVKMGR